MHITIFRSTAVYAYMYLCVCVHMCMYHAYRHTYILCFTVSLEFAVSRAHTYHVRVYTQPSLANIMQCMYIYIGCQNINCCIVGTLQASTPPPIIQSLSLFLRLIARSWFSSTTAERYLAASPGGGASQGTGSFSFNFFPSIRKIVSLNQQKCDFPRIHSHRDLN